MVLKLNPTREAYQEFYGKNVEQMPKLIADGRTPMNVSQLMQKRLDLRNGSEDVKTSWTDSYFDTGDAVVYHPDGRVKIVLDSQTLRDMTPESLRNNGALVLTDDIYNALQGKEFKKRELSKTDVSLSREDVKSHQLWNFLARDQALLNDYTDYIFTEGKQRFGYATAMGIYLSSAQGKAPECRAWCVGGLGDGSNASGWRGLDFDSGRLVGIAPEALVAPGMDAGNVRTYTMADVGAAKAQFTERQIFR